MKKLRQIYTHHKLSTDEWNVMVQVLQFWHEWRIVVELLSIISVAETTNLFMGPCNDRFEQRKREI